MCLVTFGVATFGPVNNYKCKDMSELPWAEDLPVAILINPLYSS
jgi:hypothetical protein